MRLLINLFLFFSLLPFISPMPTSSDVQLPAFVVGWIIIMLDVAHGKVRLGWVDLVFLGTAVWSFCFVLPGGEFVVRQRVGLLMAFIIYYVAKRHASRFSPLTVYAAIAFAFVATMLQWLTPDLFLSYAPRIIRTVKEIEGARGVSGPSAEPSFLAAMALVQGLLAYYYYRIGRTSGKVLAGAWAMALVMVLLSRSATGFIYVLLTFAIWIAYFMLRGLRLSVWLAASAFVATVFILMTGPLAASRGGVILVALYQNPLEVVADASFQERAVSLFLGAVSLPHYPLGAGGGSYYPVALEMTRIYQAERIFSSVRPEVFGGVLSSMGLYLAELGVVFIFFLGIVLSRSLKAEPLHLVFGALSLAFIAATFSITCPLIWLPLGLAARPEGLRLNPAASRHQSGPRRPSPEPHGQNTKALFNTGTVRLSESRSVPHLHAATAPPPRGL